MPRKYQNIFAGIFITMDINHTNVVHVEKEDIIYLKKFDVCVV